MKTNFYARTFRKYVYSHAFEGRGLLLRAGGPDISYDTRIYRSWLTIQHYTQLPGSLYINHTTYDISTFNYSGWITRLERTASDLFVSQEVALATGVDIRLVNKSLMVAVR